MWRVLGWSIGVLLLALVAAIAFVELRNRSGVRKAEAEFAASEPSPIADFGTTRTLSILPLIDWHTSSADLRGEMGVSYLIETDEHRILFDVAQNAKQESPSPLELNMKALGVELDSVDTVFISHNHFDHVGGRQRQEDRTFSVGLEQVPLPSVQAFVPIPMTYPGLSPIHSGEPTRIGKGVASTGTIPRHLVFGRIDEQALVVHVAERGAVLIVGCGHQTIPKLLERYDEVFSEPLYGVVGGLHFPVPEGRLKLLGLNAQRLLGSGNGMLSPITMDEVTEEMNELRSRNIGLLGVGGHDSSDEVIAMLDETFGDAYRHVRVGERIVVGPPE
jgi:metal-dependent hydrolase (beta-lactamase superfamily II)